VDSGGIVLFAMAILQNLGRECKKSSMKGVNVEFTQKLPIFLRYDFVEEHPVLKL